MMLVFYDMVSLLYQKDSRSATPLRIASRYELEYQLCDGGISSINGALNPIRTGQMLLVKPGTKRFTTGTYQCLSVKFSCLNSQLASKLNQLPYKAMPLNPEYTEKLLRTFYQRQVNAQKQTLCLEGLLLEILSNYIDAAQLSNEVASGYNAYVKEIYRTAEHMQANYAQHITTEQMAQQIFLCPNFYQKVFKHIMGTSPAQFLRDIRLREACRLLKNTDLSLQEIAEKCGFNCASYLIYVIKKSYGITPLEYRKKNKTLI